MNKQKYIMVYIYFLYNFYVFVYDLVSKFKRNRFGQTFKPIIIAQIIILSAYKIALSYN